MKTNILFTALLMVLPIGSVMAQDDDLYFVPKKKDKVVQSVQTTDDSHPYNVETLHVSTTTPDYHVGKLRSDEEYNRRGKYGNRYGEVYVGNDTLYITDNQQDAVEDSVEVFLDENDYGYANRLVRFHGGICSPYYWDYYYNWAYDPFFYDPFFYDPWYYGVGYYGWYGPYYGSWYRHGWYGWYDPWYCWGWGGHWGGSYHSNWAYRGHSGSRYGGTRMLNGVSASRGTRGGSAMRGTRGTNEYRRELRSNGRYGVNTSGTSTRGARGQQQVVSSRSAREQQNYTPNTSRSVNSSQRGTRNVTTQTYTPSRSYNSGSSYSGSSSRGSIGGGFSGGGFSGGSRGGSGRGGR